MADGSRLVLELEELGAQVDGLEVSACDGGELRAATRAVRQLQRSVDTLLSQIAGRAERLASEGGPGAIEVLLDDGSQVSGRTARSEVARSGIRAELPAVAAAIDEGDAGLGHLDVLARAAQPLEAEIRVGLLAADDELADAAARLPVDTFGAHVRSRIDRLRRDHGRATTAAQEAASEVRHWIGEDGMGHIRASLDPIRYEAVTGAIERQMASLARAAPEPITLGPNLAAAALVELATQSAGSPGRAQISLVVDAATASHGAHERTICETGRGSVVPPETMSRFACDAVVHKIILDTRTGRVDVGRRHRTATDAQWATLRALYTRCGWHRCDRPIDWCQAHHVTTWEDGGQTDLANLVPLCNQHHHRAHEGRWHLRLAADRTLYVRSPDGSFEASSRPDRLDRPMLQPPPKDDEDTEVDRCQPG